MTDLKCIYIKDLICYLRIQQGQKMFCQTHNDIYQLASLYVLCNIALAGLMLQPSVELFQILCFITFLSGTIYKNIDLIDKMLFTQFSYFLFLPEQVDTKLQLKIQSYSYWPISISMNLCTLLTGQFRRSTMSIRNIRRLIYSTYYCQNSPIILEDPKHSAAKLHFHWKTVRPPVIVLSLPSSQSKNDLILFLFNKYLCQWNTCACMPA